MNEHDKQVYRVWTHEYGDLHIEMLIETTSHEQAKIALSNEIAKQFGGSGPDVEDCTSTMVSPWLDNIGKDK